MKKSMTALAVAALAAAPFLCGAQSAPQTNIDSIVAAMEGNPHVRLQARIDSLEIELNRVNGARNQIRPNVGWDVNESLNDRQDSIYLSIQSELLDLQLQRENAPMQQAPQNIIDQIFNR